MRFFVPTDLRIGANIVSASREAIAALGRRCLVLTGAASAEKCGALHDLLCALDDSQIEYRVFDRIRQNPTVDVCRQTGVLASQQRADFIVGIGGGSVLDAAKAAAVFAANPDLTEDALYAYEWRCAPLPTVCIGTTAGTGSEVTPVSVLTDSAARKRSIRDDRLYPALSLGDPRYLASLPSEFTRSCAVDAAAHCIESFFNRNATPISRLFASRGAATLAKLLDRLDALQDGERERLYLASVYGGYAISVTGTAFPHAMGYFLTEQYGVPHGTACAVFLPAFLRHIASAAPQDADAFAAQTGCGMQGWTELLERTTPPCAVTLTDAQIASLRPRFIRNSGMARTVGTFTDADAVRTLTEIFNKKGV
jgi:alcohol dehydrogenase class IV